MNMKISAGTQILIEILIFILSGGNFFICLLGYLIIRGLISSNKSKEDDWDGEYEY